MLAAALLAGCGGATTPAPALTRVPSHIRVPSGKVRVAVVVLENHGPDAVLGPGWLGDAARGGGVAVDAHGETHPSLGNYLAMISGSTQGVSDDDVTHGPYRVPTLAGQLDGAGLAWKAYTFGTRAPCSLRGTGVDETGRYARRHNPFLFFVDASGTPSRCRAHVVPGTRLATDLRGPGLPRLSWITPDLCQDMHNCSVATGQRWMARTLPAVIRALGPRGVLVVTADEGIDDAGGGGRIPLVVLGAGARPGAELRAKVDHRSVLATIEDLLGVARLATTRHAGTLQALLKG